MAPSVTTVFADDLTGACEIAGIVHRHGFSATVALTPDATADDADILVVDTETRLFKPEQAAHALTHWLRHPSLAARPGRIFKKTDSILRGPVAAELVTVATHTRASRIVLVPANPALGRIVRDGRYLIDGVPLDETAFKLDPHHPARSSSTSELIGNVHGFPSHNLDPGDPQPAPGLIIGNASTVADLAQWATRFPTDTLAAGSAAFFDALLATSSHHRERELYPTSDDSPFLLISGTTAPAQRSFLATARSRGLPTIEVPARTESAADVWTMHIQEKIRLYGGVCTYPYGTVSSKPAVAAVIRNTLAAIGRAMVVGHHVQHLIIEGGSTAAAIAASLSWCNFRVVHEWAPGVVTVAPDAHPNLRVTLKPGSYPWPAALLKLIFHRKSAPT